MEGCTPDRTGFAASQSRTIARACWVLEISNADVVSLLHRNRDVCVPGNINLVANLDLIEHSRINDTPAVFPSVWTSEGDRRCVLVDIGDSHGHRSLHGCGAPGPLTLPRGGAAGRRVDRGLARRL